jgi:hypothetical protein
MTPVDRLLRACATGVGCRAVINMKVLNGIPRAQWPDIARRPEWPASSDDSAPPRSPRLASC